MTHLDNFMDAYARNLADMTDEWSLREALTLREVILSGNFDNETPEMEKTCIDMCIPNTKESIREFVTDIDQFYMFPRKKETCNGKQ